MKIHLLLITFILNSCTNNSAMLNNTIQKTRNAFPAEPLTQLLKNVTYKADDVLLLIDKSEYTLQFQIQGKTIKTYPVVFGGNPIDDKRMEGDNCTPEGNFAIRDLYPHAKWSKFLWVNYPTDESQEKYEVSKDSGEIPSDATIGGEIGIHGVPNNNNTMIDNKTNWTQGCISLKNADVDEIFGYVQIGTRIYIQK